MHTKLSENSEKTIIDCAHRFDGYAYLKAVTPEENFENYQSEMQKYVERTGKLFADPLKNMAANFFLHRSFYFQGWLPSAFTPPWYQMVFCYLHLYRLPTPPKYRHQQGAREWESREQGAAENAAAEIRQTLMQQRS